MGRDVDSTAEFTTAVGVQEDHEIAQRRRHDTIRFTGTNKTPSFESSSGGEGRDANLNEVAWLIANQKETIDNHTTDYYR
jgi:hypothetical protein